MVENEGFREEPIINDERIFLKKISQLSDDELRRPPEQQERLSNEKIYDFYNEIAGKFSTAGYPVPDSVVRLDQEAKIVEDLDAGKKVLIRGYWRMGKTSLMSSIATHFYPNNSLRLDASRETSSASIDEFKHRFAAEEISEFIALKELAGADWDERVDYEEEVLTKLLNSGAEPLIYLNDYLRSKGTEAYLGIDELISFADQAEKLQYLADLNLDHIKLVMVLHRLAKYEPALDELFRDNYSKHFVRPLTGNEEHLLLSEPLRNTGLSFDKDAEDEIGDFSGGRPLEINCFANALMRSNSKFFQPKKTYGLKQTETINQSALYPLNDSFEVPIETYRKIFNTALSDKEKVIVTDSAHSRNLNSLTDEEARPLVESAVLVPDPENGYRTNGELFKKVVLSIENSYV